MSLLYIEPKAADAAAATKTPVVFKTLPNTTVVRYTVPKGKTAYLVCISSAARTYTASARMYRVDGQYVPAPNGFAYPVVFAEGTVISDGSVGPIEFVGYSV